MYKIPQRIRPPLHLYFELELVKDLKELIIQNYQRKNKPTLLHFKDI